VVVAAPLVAVAAVVMALPLVGFLVGVFRRLVERQVAGNLHRFSRTSPLLVTPNGVVATTTGCCGQGRRAT
jgi:hypothetical protein